MDALQAASQVALRLTAAGHEALFAGGCVRDRLMGRPPKDYDLATSATPDELADEIEFFDETKIESHEITKANELALGCMDNGGVR